MASPGDLAERVLQGDRGALARAITITESDTSAGMAILRPLQARMGNAHVIGITGPPGAGKSTLVGQLCRHLRADGRRVAVVAIDPSSPLTGGAILGDRIRMEAAGSDEGIFVRSLATRGQVGGLSRSASDVVDLMDAAGYDVVLIETVGAGQSEVDVMACAHTVVVVAVPNLGDEVQASKAGMMEIADLFAVNKADMAGAQDACRHLEVAVAIAPARGGWRPQVVLTQARTGKGMDELVQTLAEHAVFLRGAGRWGERRQRVAESRLLNAVTEAFMAEVQSSPAGAEWWAAAVGAVAERQIDAAGAIRALLRRGRFDGTIAP